MCVFMRVRSKTGAGQPVALIMTRMATALASIRFMMVMRFIGGDRVGVFFFAPARGARARTISLHAWRCKSSLLGKHALRVVEGDAAGPRDRGTVCACARGILRAGSHPVTERLSCSARVSNLEAGPRTRASRSSRTAAQQARPTTDKIARR